MGERLSQELRAFQELAQAAASGPYDPDALVDRICREVAAAFDLGRADFVGGHGVAARHPLIERARRERQAVTDGTRVAAPLCVDDDCLGFVIGDAEGRPLDLDEPALQLLTALARVGAVFVAKADEHGRLERSLDERTNFVSLASHELRTPIAVVHGIVSTLHLRGDELDPEQLHDLRATAYEQTSRLALLTEQLLDLSRLEAGAVANRREGVRLRQLVDELLLRTVPQRLADVVVEVDPELQLESDPDALERVLSNLIVNALRYGQPQVHVRVEGPRIVVEDCGKGVDPTLVPRLFERFTRGPRDSGGAGLGLAIARSYAEALGGSLVYEQAVPHGARFALVLPRLAARRP
jgi:two-component system sensor histidine kinase KdpD